MARKQTVPAAPEVSIGDLVDELAITRVKIAELETVESKLKDQVIGRCAEAGKDSAEGAQFRALVVRSTRNVFDTKAAKLALGPKKVAALTSLTHTVSVRTAPRVETLAAVALKEAA